MNIRFIKSKEKKEIESKLKEKYGIEKLPYLLFETGKEKIRAFSGSMNKDEILQLSRIANIEIIGTYLAKKEKNNELRLSFDAPHLLKNITKNVIEISDEQLKSWLRGEDLDIKAESSFVIIKNKEDFIGSGKSTGEKIINHIPKDRRLRR